MFREVMQLTLLTYVTREIVSLEGQRVVLFSQCQCREEQETKVTMGEKCN